MWKQLIIATLVALACGLPVSVYGGEYDDFEDAHPLRLVAYPLHAVGYGLERLIIRPIHSLVSRPALAPIFGHTQDDFSLDQHPTGVSLSGAVPVARPLSSPVRDPGALDTARPVAEQARRPAAGQVAEKSLQAFDPSLLKELGLGGVRPD